MNLQHTNVNLHEFHYMGLIDSKKFGLRQCMIVCIKNGLKSSTMGRSKVFATAE